MIIQLSERMGLPNEQETTISVHNDIITVNNIEYDLSDIPEGGEAIPEGTDHPFINKITRKDGIIYCTIQVILGSDADDYQPTDPEYWNINVSDGPVIIPAIRKSIHEYINEDIE